MISYIYCNHLKRFSVKTQIWVLNTEEKCKINNLSKSLNPFRRGVIKFVSDLRQVGGFLRVLRFPPPIKVTATG